MKATNKFTTLASVAIASVLAIGALTVSAQSLEDSDDHEEHRAQHKEIHEAVENNDYETWAELMEDKEKFPAPVTEDTFDRLVQAKKLKEEGNTVEAKEIMESLGLKGFRGRHKHNAQRRNFDPEKREAVEEALESGDYNAWTEAVGENSKKLEQINADNFSKLAEAHTLREAGDHEAAKEIMEELGIKKPGRNGHGCHGKNGFGPRNSGPQNQA